MSASQQPPVASRQPSRLLPIAACVLTGALAGCSGASSKSSPPGRLRFEDTSAGVFVGKLRDSQGGEQLWRQYAGVRFAYRVTWPGGGRSFARVGFRFDDFEHLWVEEKRGDEAQIVPIAPTYSIFEVLEPMRTDEDGGVGAATLDFAMRAVRFFFAPALVTCDGRWQYQELMAPSPLAMSTRLEVHPIESSPPSGPYLLEPHSRTGRLARILYRGDHPLVRGKTQQVVFRDYSPVAGLTIALEREHRRPRAGRSRGTVVDPFRSEEPLPPFVVFLTERMDRVEFLTAAEVDEQLPLPEDGDESAAGTGASTEAGDDRQAID